ncbi:MAG: aspartate aminotransferase family protein [Acidiferrobacterales bacterium]|nr:aspartate aminotransferase family protein [Acidiferrobacterales bacterium]
MVLNEPNQASVIDLGHKSYTPNYKPRDIVFRSGSGCHLQDMDGNEYLDLGSGIGVNSLGHRHPEIVDALNHQASRIWHTSNIYFTEPPVRLASRIIDRTFAEKIFFCNSGAEANEAAIKVVRKYAYENHAPEKRVIITFEGSFHGRTIASVTATAQPKYHEGFGPLPAGFRYCAFNDLDSFRTALKEDVCAVLLEPIQGEGGIRPFSVDFLTQVRKLCDENESLLIFDEIQCGMGRTGQLFAYEWAHDVVPDVVTIAKALGGGLPIGATLLGSKLNNVLSLGSHGSTFGGNPVCCAVADVVFKKLSDADFLSRIRTKGEYLVSRLTRLNECTGFFEEIRGKGLMIGMQISQRHGDIAAQVMQSCLEEGLLILQSGPNVIRLLPALTISDEEINRGVELLEKALKRHI